MDAVTYPADEVQRFINNAMIPLRLPFDSKPYSVDFNVKWTPTLITLDPGGKEHHRTVGFLAPDEILPSLMLGIAKTEYDVEHFDDAITDLDGLLAGFPKSDSSAEATFLRGVSRFKKTHEPSHLKAAYEELHSRYPGSQWEKRALPYSSL